MSLLQLLSDPLAWWSIGVSLLVSIPCSVLGCYLVLRRMSLLGDAISHAILPGIVLAYVFSGGAAAVPMFAGAIVVGVLTAVLTQSLHTFGRVSEDSSMGVVFTSLFALGVVLLAGLGSRVHLDVDCMIFGKIETALIDTTTVGGIDVPRVVPNLAFAGCAVAIFVTLLWKELKIASFDPALATAMGLRAAWVHYALMALVALVAVASFEAAGSILVVAMLIVPAATAYLLTDRLGSMLLLSMVVACISSLGGCLAALRFNRSVPGLMATVAGAQFALAVAFGPRHGLVPRWIGRWLLSLRIVSEDVAAMLYRAEELASRRGRPPGLERSVCAQAAGGGPMARLALTRLRWNAETQSTADGRIVLTDRGRSRAQSLVRSHRLWEAYLVAHFELPLDHLHEPAERVEHFIGPDLQERLAAELQLPDLDPHGRTIPPAVTGDPLSPGER